jgi:hypothetical protein
MPTVSTCPEDYCVVVVVPGTVVVVDRGVF